MQVSPFVMNLCQSRRNARGVSRVVVVTGAFGDGGWIWPPMPRTLVTRFGSLPAHLHAGGLLDCPHCVSSKAAQRSAEWPHH